MKSILVTAVLTFSFFGLSNLNANEAKFHPSFVNSATGDPVVINPGRPGEGCFSGGGGVVYCCSANGCRKIIVV